MNVCKLCGCEGNGMRCEVCGGITCEAVDSVFRAIGAFDGFADIATKQRENGYVPTVYGDTRRKRIAIRVLKASGLKVWGNKGKNW